MPNLFNKKILSNRIKDFSIENIDEKIEKIKNWQQSLSKIKGLNEKRLQSAFLKAIFEDILGYENTPQKKEWTLDIEATTDVDAKHPDGILGFFERIDNEEIRGHEAVIELKGPQISLDKDQKRQGTTYKSPVDQAFSYTNKLDKCKWIIVSNFMEIRLYKVGRSKEYYEVFLLDELDKKENFKKFYYLLNKTNLLSETGESVSYKLSEKTLKKEEDISVEFYNLYKNVRINLFEHLKANNPDKNPELLLEKAQKFLDRIIFIGFCEDKGLLPNDLLHEAIQRGKESFSPSNTAVWDQIRGVFRSIDEGNAVHNINAYNGGLFKYDQDLDGLVIENDFFEAIYKISDYDFDSDVDVNILGHIFEQSISDLEKLKSDIKDDEFDKNESRRKKDGIFYTPQYITAYIVENAIGGYLEDLKEDLGYYELPDIEEAGSARWKTTYTNQHLDFYNEYEEKLKEIKVLDPACGSGAFLNQAFDYLLEEHNWLNKQRDLLKGGQSSIFALDSVQRDILKNNIFGVDLNEESVEITKLSLWLKTANKRKALTNLDDNIKCGNSLIDDLEVAGDKAFKWGKEFEDIIKNGGFDVIVGNPPYIRSKFLPEDIRNYLYDNYFSSLGTFDIYITFIEKGIHLLKQKGLLGFINSNKYFYSDYGEKIREFILNEVAIKEIIDFDEYQVFRGATTYTTINIFRKTKEDANYNFKYRKIVNKNIKEAELANFIDDKDNKNSINISVNQNSFYNNKWSFKNKKFNQMKSYIQNNSIPLEDFCYKIYQGFVLTPTEVFIVSVKEKDNDFFKITPLRKDDSSYFVEKELLIPLTKSSNIKRYYFEENDYYAIFPYKSNDYKNFNLIKQSNMKQKYPKTFEYLKVKSDWLRQRENGRWQDSDKWYEYSRVQNFECSKMSKIIVPGLATNSRFSLAPRNTHLDQGSYGIILKEKYKEMEKVFLGILNSQLIEVILKSNSSTLSGGYYNYQNKYLKKLPIKIPNDKLKNKLIFNVETIISYKKKNQTNKKKKILKDFILKYASKDGISLKNIINNKEFKNKIYSGRASKIRNFTVNINTNIITIYLDKSSSGKYEILKFEENDRYKRQYLKYYLENLTAEQLAEIDEKYSGNILKKTLEIGIPDYDKDHVVKKVVKEWDSLQQEIRDLENEIEVIDKKIDQMIYRLYDLTEEEIEIIENN